METSTLHNMANAIRFLSADEYVENKNFELYKAVLGIY